MKADIHPDYHEITVVMTDGKEFKTRSTYGKEGDVLKLDVDPLTHPAWQGGAAKVVEKGQLDKFEGRYGSFLSGDTGAKKQETKQDAPTAEAKPEEAPTKEAKAETPAEETQSEEKSEDAAPTEEASKEE